jgi:hypothetical protein
MCLICIEIKKNNLKSEKEVSEFMQENNIDPEFDHYFDSLAPLMEKHFSAKYRKATDCSCGAKYTSFPEHHLKYCEAG